MMNHDYHLYDFQYYLTINYDIVLSQVYLVAILLEDLYFVDLNQNLFDIVVHFVDIVDVDVAGGFVVVEHNYYHHHHYHHQMMMMLIKYNAI